MVNVINSYLRFHARHNWRGLQSLLKLFRGGNLPPLIRTRTCDGLWLDIDPNNYMDQFILNEGYYEREVLEALVPFINNDTVLWDVGANIGLHSITAKHLFPGMRVVCFEPSPYNFVRLYTNAKLNSCDMALINVALSDHSGYENLSVNIYGHHGVTSLRPWSHVNYEFSYACRCETGKALLNQKVIPTPTIIKIDVENLEYEVLLGFQDILEDSMLRAVIFEDQSSDKKASAAYSLLESKGFFISELPPSNRGEKQEVTNFLAQRAAP